MHTHCARGKERMSSLVIREREMSGEEVIMRRRQRKGRAISQAFGLRTKRCRTPSKRATEMEISVRVVVVRHDYRAGDGGVPEQLSQEGKQRRIRDDGEKKRESRKNQFALTDERKGREKFCWWRRRSSLGE